MYYPYLRGLRFELLTLRNTLENIPENQFLPILEPVRENFDDLIKCLDVYVEAEREIIVIVNPGCGHLTYDDSSISDLILQNYSNSSVCIGFIIDERFSESIIKAITTKHSGSRFFFIHQALVDSEFFGIELSSIDQNHVFPEKVSNSIYRKPFPGLHVLLKDGCSNYNRNADLPSSEYFSDTHLTYVNRGFDGFGDYLTIGGYHRENGGGRAYTLAINLTHLTPKGMDIYHFLSDDRDSPENPSGKFLQAATHLSNAIKNNNPNFAKTHGLNSLVELYEDKHYPGPGKLKELSMNHHIEILSTF